MSTNQTPKVQHHIWDKDGRQFVANGAPLDVPVSIPAESASTRPLSRDQFLGGPVPWDWLIRANHLSRTALVVGLCLWRLSGVKRSRTIMLGTNELTPFGIDRAAKSRALTALEKAGLIRAERRPGRFPVVTLPAREIRRDHRAPSAVAKRNAHK